MRAYLSPKPDLMAAAIRACNVREFATLGRCSQIWLYRLEYRRARDSRRTQMPFYENGDVRIHYEEAGSGFPLLLIPGGGLNSNIGVWTSSGPFDAVNEFKDHFRCITMDQRNANGGQSTGPLRMDNPWDGYSDDQLGLMSYLGCEQFLVLGCCIGGPFLWNLIQRAPERVVAAVMCQPSGFRPEQPTLFYDNNIKG